MVSFFRCAAQTPNLRAVCSCQGVIVEIFWWKERNVKGCGGDGSLTRGSAVASISYLANSSFKSTDELLREKFLEHSREGPHLSVSQWGPNWLVLLLELKEKVTVLIKSCMRLLHKSTRSPQEPLCYITTTMCGILKSTSATSLNKCSLTPPVFEITTTWFLGEWMTNKNKAKCN